MQRRAAILLLSSAMASVGCASRPLRDSRKFDELPDPWHFNIESYLRSAMELQSLGRKATLAVLRSQALSFNKNIERYTRSNIKLIVLCRLLFTQKSGSAFRRPGLGAASFMGGTDYVDWPREPIEIVDGVPFVITRGYILRGMEEPADWYIRYCEESCDWVDSLYNLKSRLQYHEALNRLLASPKWKKPLEPAEIQFITDQVPR